MLDRRTLLLGGAGLGIAALSGGSSPPKKSCRQGKCSPLPHYADGTPANLIRAPQYAPDLPVRAYTGVVLELPPELRTKNWGGGSCVHASTVNLLIWMGLYDLAAWWRENYSGGEYDTRLIARMEAAGLKYAFSYDDPTFFDWCTRTRRGAGIFYKPSHSINFVGILYSPGIQPGLYKDREVVNLLDNNHTDYPEKYGHYEMVVRSTFEQKWMGYGGFAWTLIYDPQPGNPIGRRRIL